MVGRKTLVLALYAVLVGAACNTAPFTERTPPDCEKSDCTCEQDPSQPTCRGLPGLPDGGIGASDGDVPALEDAGAQDGAPDDASADDSGDAA